MILTCNSSSTFREHDCFWAKPATHSHRKNQGTPLHMAPPNHIQIETSMNLGSIFYAVLSTTHGDRLGTEDNLNYPVYLEFRVVGQQACSFYECQLDDRN